MVGKSQLKVLREKSIASDNTRVKYIKFEEISESSYEDSEVSSNSSQESKEKYSRNNWLATTKSLFKSKSWEVEENPTYKELTYEQRHCKETMSEKEHRVHDMMWKYYPKQVQNILKKKRIDRERLRRSLKPPGKRNYKVLFANVKHICNEEVYRASHMMKRMKDNYYKMLHSERRVFKALREKGLFLDRKDFNIMEVFNSEFYNLSSEYDQESESVYLKRKFNDDVNEFESTSAKGSEAAKEKQKETIEAKNDNGDVRHKFNEFCNFDIASLNKSWTPISCHFEPISNYSKLTHKSRSTFISRKSQRMLFQDCQVERREPSNCHMPQGKDFIWRWNKNNLLLYYPIFEIYPYAIDSDNHSETHSFEHSELLRSISMPIPHHYIEDKMIEPLGL